MLSRGWVFCLSVIVFCASFGQAASVTSSKAEKAAKGWLNTNPEPLNMPVPGKVASIDAYQDQNGEPMYFVVNLSPEGYVIVSCDDLLEPVIAFSAAGTYQAVKENPLYAIMEKDARARIRHLRQSIAKSKQAAKTKEQQKWDKLSSQADQNYRIYSGLSSVTDVRVAPLVQSRWDQMTAGGSACYNYYTPSNYPCGCVATAMAQLMRYHQHPATAVVHQLYPYTVTVDNATSSYSAYPKGGNGSGGAYSWSNMPLIPDSSLTSAQRIGIGGICFDAGLSCQMDYGPTGSGAYISNARDGLVQTFMYSNAVYALGLDGSFQIISIPAAALQNIVNSNLDAALPVLLGISVDDPQSAGHAVLADGYGYNSGTLYHHINMGWSGSADAWYNMPVIYDYDVVDTLIYNVYPTGTGEIISGRIADEAGLPVQGATVRLFDGQTQIKSVTTNQYGLYGFSKVPANKTYDVVPEKTNYTIPTRQAMVGLSEYDPPYNCYKCGNVSGFDFVAAAVENGTPPTAGDIEVTATGGTDVEIELTAADDGLPLVPGELSYIITSLPEHGTLTDPGFGEILVVPYTLQNSLHKVMYQSCSYSPSPNQFTYKANDGGTAPSGGDSNEATATITFNYDAAVHEEGNYLSNYPFCTTWQDCRMQVIYLASEFGTAKKITGLEFRIYKKPLVMNGFTIRMQHTAMDVYPTSPDFVNDGWTTVLQTNLSIPATGWQRVDFQTPFTYNGTDNVLVDISYNNTGPGVDYGQSYGFDTGDPNRVMYQRARDSQGDPLLWTVAMFGGAYYTSDIAPVLRLHGESAVAPLVADFDVSCSVGMDDLMAFVGVWMAQDGDGVYDSLYDISTPADQAINLADFAVLASEWLQ